MWSDDPEIMPQDTAVPQSNESLSWTHPSTHARSHAVTRIAWTSPARRNILGAFPSSSSRISSVATRCGIEPYSAAPPRRGIGPQPSSDAEASTDRAPRPAVWASTALSSGRVAVRGAGATGGKRGAAGRAGASRGRQPLPTSPREAAGERVQEATGGAGRLGRR